MKTACFRVHSAIPRPDEAGGFSRKPFVRPNSPPGRVFQAWHQRVDAGSLRPPRNSDQPRRDQLLLIIMISTAVLAGYRSPPDSSADAGPNGGFGPELRPLWTQLRARARHGTARAAVLCAKSDGSDLLEKRRATDRDAAGLAALAEERVFKRFYLVSQDAIYRRRRVGAAVVEFMPYDLFLRRLWSGRLEGLPET